MRDKTLAIVLAGGVGARLQPLTTERAKAAVPFAGTYRIIDFTLTNCLHSGLRQVLVLTQYKSHSLLKHLRDGWTIFNPEIGEYITAVPPQMRNGESWYTGTANAIYQNLYLVERSGAEWVIILSGDHIYRMDYSAMLEFHKSHGGDLTIAAMELGSNEAHGFGVMRVNDNERITEFAEHPEWSVPIPDNPGPVALASMGIYIFSTELLVDCVKKDHITEGSNHDFAKDVVPSLIDARPVYAYRFGGTTGRVTMDRYWRDAGTLDSYYDANMDLLRPVPPLNLYQDDWPIRTYQGQHPPARTVPGMSGTEGIFINAIVASGVVIAGGSVHHSILFPRVFVGDEAMVEDALLLDGVRVGDGARLKHCIIDKNVQIPRGERIGYNLSQDREHFTVTEKGIVVVPRGYRFA